MRVQFRSSGGRGEYEVAGAHGPITPRDLIDYDLRVDLGPWGVKDTRVFVADTAGKTRLRRRDANDRTLPQLHRQITAALMLPAPARGRSIARGATLISAAEYHLAHFDCSDVVFDQTAHAAALTFGACTVATAAGEDTFSVPIRIARVAAIYDRATEFASPLDDLLRQHADVVQAPGPYRDDLERVVRAIMHEVDEQAPAFDLSYVAGLDVLPALEQMLAIATPLPQPVNLASIESPEIKKRETQYYRMTAARGPQAVKFGRDVRAAYRDTCVFCGVALPKAGDCRRPGVDGMHILGHARYELNVVSNGLCGCKLDHWAFDEGLLTLDVTENGYVVRLTPRGETVLGASGALDRFRSLEGSVPRDRLPAADADCPSPVYLAEFNRLMGN